MSGNGVKYTQEQLDIAVLKNTNEGILRILFEIKTDMKSQFFFNIGLTLGIYAIICGAFVSKIFGAW
jgi:hypothetical protein